VNRSIILNFLFFFAISPRANSRLCRAGSFASQPKCPIYLANLSTPGILCSFEPYLLRGFVVTFKICLCKTGWSVYQTNSHGHVCKFNGYSRDQHNTSADIACEHFFTRPWCFTVGTVDGCRILNAFCTFSNMN